MLVLVFAAYPISYGPAYRLVIDGWIPVSVFMRVYRPIEWCRQQSNTCDRVVYWNLNQFRRNR